MLPSVTEMETHMAALRKTNPAAYSDLQTFTFSKTAAIPDNPGDSHTFKVYNIDKSKDSPFFDDVTATLRGKDGDIRIWVQDSEWENSHVTQQVVDDVLQDLLYSTPQGSLDPNKGIVAINEWSFGQPPNIDGSGRTHFLMTDIQDGYDGSGNFVGGFFFSYDQTTQPGSNKTDILYIDTYPGIYNDKRDPIYKPEAVLGTVAHEFQHLIHYNYDPGEESWVNEGLSELASYLCGYGLRSPERYLNNSDLSMTDWNDDDPLPHYSRVALWSYFLYERYGRTTIRAIVQEATHGVVGVNRALNAQNGVSFVAVLENFFKTLMSNDPLNTPDYSFRWSALQYLRASPAERITEYPQNKSWPVASYAMRLVELTNGDSVTVAQDRPFSGPVYYNAFGLGGTAWLETPLFPLKQFDLSGEVHTLELGFFNISGTNDVIALDVSGRQKYDLITLEYGSDKPTFVIGSDGATNAIHYIAPRDSTFIKTVSFYNYSSSGAVEIQIYDRALALGGRPAYKKVILENPLRGGWASVDVENIKQLRMKNDFLDVGVYYPQEGTMGYETSAAIEKNYSGRSYLRQNATSTFLPLKNFKTGSGSLDGIWMIKLEVAAPYSGRSSGNIDIDNIQVYPVPYVPSENPLTIEYEANGGGRVEFSVFNVLGRLVYNEIDDQGRGLFLWDGRNLQGTRVASGFYIVRITGGKKAVFKKVVVLK
ncbi:MAG TPA: T9SS type A sorting domain-containing protein [Caldithrix abyssi]|uniref:T9SS type A sorting domain-containing protein n=1 Tax=Caldithrix abyssi TaxID=187145 RepID=A0A7V1LPB9_CALAY|nr:T9SS type A sorting domain-containing protein [Caldithrix abyssi]